MKRSRKSRAAVRFFMENDWVIHRDKFHAIEEVIARRAEGVRLTEAEIRLQVGEQPKRQAIGRMMETAVVGRVAGSGSSMAQAAPSKVALIRAHGVLAPRMNMFMRYSGGTSYEQFAAAVEKAANDPRCKAIVIDFDTPGGSAAGCLEAAARISKVRGKKKIIGVVNHHCYSGGYWLAVQCDEIVVSPSGGCGSVGVIASHLDTTEAEKKAGLSRTIFRFPEEKTEGAFGETLSESAKEHRMTQVRTIYESFAGDVAARRNVSREHVQSNFARDHLAADAVRLGLADRVASLGDVLTELGVGVANDNSVEDDEDEPAYVRANDMNPKLFGLLVQIGMCGIDATMSVAENALDRFFAAKGIEKPESVEAQIEVLEKHRAEQLAPKPAVTQPTAPAASNPAPPASPAPAADRTASNEDRSGAIMAALRLATNLSDADRFELGTQLISDHSVSLPDALARIQDRVAANQTSAGPTITAGAAERDKLHLAARNALLSRHFGNNVPSQVYDRRTDSMVALVLGDEVRDRSLSSLPRLAEACLISAGVSRNEINRAPNFVIAQVAMGLKTPYDAGFSVSEGPAYNTTGGFANILLDASNVILRNGYGEVPTTFQEWAVQGQSLPDFKPVHKVIGGELPDPKAIPEDGTFDETTYSDGRESYKLTVWGEVFSISWQAVVDDKLSEFVSIPNKQGRAMRRKQNKLVYGVLNDNAALSDSVALFHASHNNLLTGAVSDYTSQFSKMRAKMATHSGLTDGTTVQIDPKFVLYPIVDPVEHNILTALASMAPPAVGGSAAGSSGVTNIWRGRLTPIGDADLSAARGGSDTAFYTVADGADIETVEYAYLQGLETPALDSMAAFDRLALRFRIYQAFATKAIDYRGFCKSVGA